jgi:hypothetical protein
MAMVVLETSHSSTLSEQQAFQAACSQWRVTAEWLNAHTCRLTGDQESLEVLEVLWHVAHRPMPSCVPEA